MKEISRQLLYQRLRNRVIELMELHTSVKDIANLGAFEVLNMVDGWLPLNYEEAPKVFNKNEKAAITSFLKLANVAADVSVEDTWDVQWFNNSAEWSELSTFARQSLAVFMVRGRFSEDREEVLPP